ncbi:MAG: class II glutamine amidotransferase [Candidatus Thorarchaeota archaeon]
MCDLLGMSFNIPATISLDVFQTHGKENPDGWGVGYYNEHGLQLIKEPAPATDSTLYDFVESHMKSKLFLSHVRRTTMGIRSYLNTHPFYRITKIGDARTEYTFAHNGTLQNIEKLKLNSYQPLGETDSERAFCYILDAISERKIVTWTQDDFAFLNDLLREINDQSNTFNCLFSDGTHLFCYSDENRHNDGLRFVKRDHPFGLFDLVRQEEKLGLIEIRSVNVSDVTDPDATGYLIVTEELTDEDWIDFEGGELVVFRNGAIVYPNLRIC